VTALRMPALFIGHGNPMNALRSNAYTAAWRALGTHLPRPTAIVAVSAHWYTPGTFVTAEARPATIHDFGGFPRELYEVRYPSPGSPVLAERLVSLLAPVSVRPDTDWGLDHGTWSVLVHLYPHADVPVVQLSIDATQPPQFHYALGRRLAALRDEGVLVLGSGNIVHNLARADWSESQSPPAWAVEFDAKVSAHLLAGDDAPLVDYAQLAAGAVLAVPTPEHYLPLLYALGARLPGDSAALPVTGFDLATVSMAAVLLEGA
jgi:4,5-DOPA dioxygenase extradiol